MAKQLKLKTLLEDVFNERPQVNKYEVAEGVRSYGVVGKQLYNNSNIMEIAKQLSHIAEQAHTHVVSETDDWFDQVSVNKNMQSLKKRVSEFQKTAQESHQLNQRLTGLYEDMGHVLNRYYDINEDIDMNEDLKSSDIGSGENQLSGDAAKSSPEYNKDKKYKYNESADGDNDKDIEDYLEKPNKTNSRKKHNFKMVPTESQEKEIENAVKETAMNKKPTKRLKDISLVSLSPVGLFKKSGK